jgi:aldehyde:ferredoxin oxidoreductase
MEPLEFEYELNPPEKGRTDRVLMVDLNEFEVGVKTVTPEERELYLGGRGYCLWLLWEGTEPGTKWDDPSNVLVMAGGLLGGEPGWPGSGKFISGTISPLTGTFIDSNVGGHFAPLLKFSGFDAVAVTGKADRPVVVVVDGDESKVTIRPWNGPDGAIMMCEELFDELQGDGNRMNLSAATAGPGADHSYHGIVNSVYFDKRRGRLRSKQAGRGGTGTVMRDKNLMAIAVKCNKPKPGAIAADDPEEVKKWGSAIRKLIKEVDPIGLQLDKWGTTVLVEYMDKFDLLPTYNYQTGHHDDAKQIYPEVWADRYFNHGIPDGCYLGCTLACAKGMEGHKLMTGPYAGETVGVDGPEYETAATGPVVGIFDPEYLLDYNWYCDDYGLDTISVGITMGFLFEAYDRGYLTYEETGGLPLEWGNMDAALELLHQIACGEGFGADVGKGIRHCTDKIAQMHAARTGRDEAEVHAELEEFGMQCKGLEFSVYVTKESLAQQGGYGFALKGPQHDEAWLIFLDQVNNEMPTFELKAKALRWFPLFRTWFNAMGLCKLPWIDVRHPDASETDDPAKNLPNAEYFAKYAGAVRGKDMTLDDLIAESERLYTLQKLFNLRQGFGRREHDGIPMRAMGPVFWNEYEQYAQRYDEEIAATDGEDAVAGMSNETRLARIKELRKERFWKLADAVYEERGWDVDGVPKPELLKKVGLTDPVFTQVADEARKQ